MAEWGSFEADLVEVRGTCFRCLTLSHSFSSDEIATTQVSLTSSISLVMMASAILTQQKFIKNNNCNCYYQHYLYLTYM